MLIELEDNSVAFIFAVEENILNKWQREQNANPGWVIRNYVISKLGCESSDLEVLNPSYLANYGVYEQAFSYLDSFLKDEKLFASQVDTRKGLMRVHSGAESHMRFVRVVRIAKSFIKRKRSAGVLVNKESKQLN